VAAGDHLQHDLDEPAECCLTSALSRRRDARRTRNSGYLDLDLCSRARGAISHSRMTILCRGPSDSQYSSRRKALPLGRFDLGPRRARNEPSHTNQP